MIEESVMVGLSREDLLCRSKWIIVTLLASGVESSHPRLLVTVSISPF